MPEPPSQTTPVQISPGGQSFYSTQSSPSASEVNDAIAIAMPTESPDMDENALLLQTSKKITYSGDNRLPCPFQLLLTLQDQGHHIQKKSQ